MSKRRNSNTKATDVPPGMCFAGEEMWHYTIGAKLPYIANSGALLPIPTRGAPKTERPVVWLSKHPFFEPTSAKGFTDFQTGTWRILSMQETHEMGQGLFRFKVKKEQLLHSIFGFKSRSRIKPAHFDMIWKEGIRQGADPMQWFVSFDPIPLTEIERIEAWDGQQWLHNLSHCSAWDFEESILKEKEVASEDVPDGVRTEWSAMAIQSGGNFPLAVFQSSGTAV